MSITEKCQWMATVIKFLRRPFKIKTAGRLSLLLFLCICAIYSCYFTGVLSFRQGINVTGLPLEIRFRWDPSYPIYLTQIEFIEQDTVTGQSRVLWKLRARGGNMLPLVRVKYGEVPSGFDQDQPAVSLSDSAVCHIIIDGPEGHCQFFIPAPSRIKCASQYIVEDKDWAQVFKPLMPNGKSGS
jgi:hypothetical protein